jgi:hypothetical protein
VSQQGTCLTTELGQNASLPGLRELSMSRFLFVMWEGGGTVPPELAIARRLIARGHAVYVLGDPTIEAGAKAIGASYSLVAFTYLAFVGGAAGC